MMRARLVLVAVCALLTTRAAPAQETRPVPKDSMRVAIPGCAKGRILTAGPRTEAQPGSLDVPEGTHLRMNGPKALLKEIAAHEGSVVVITGLVKKGQYKPGVGIGGRVGITGGAPPVGGIGVNAVPPQIFIDVEGWRTGVGECRSR